MSGNLFISIDDTETDELRKRIDQLETKNQELEYLLNEQVKENEQLTSFSFNKNNSYFIRADEVRHEKEILWLKEEIRKRDQQIVDLGIKVAQFKQKTTEYINDISRKEMQINTLTQRRDSYAAECKLLENGLNMSRDEMAQLASKLSFALAELQRNQQAFLDEADNTVRLRKELAALRARLKESGGPSRIWME